MFAIRRPPLLDGRDDRGEVVVEQHEVGRLAGDVRAAPSHRDADVGRLEGRAVVDAVAGHRHDVAARAQGPGDPELVLRVTRLTTTPSRSRSAPSAASSAGQVAALERRARRRPSSPTSAAMALAVPGWSPVTMATLIPCARQAAIGVRRAGPWRVFQADQPEQLQVLFQARRRPAVRSADARSPSRRSGGDGDDAQAAMGQRVQLLGRALRSAGSAAGRRPARP